MLELRASVQASRSGARTGGDTGVSSMQSGTEAKRYQPSWRRRLRRRDGGTGGTVGAGRPGIRRSVRRRIADRRLSEAVGGQEAEYLLPSVYVAAVRRTNTRETERPRGEPKWEGPTEVAATSPGTGESREVLVAANREGSNVAAV
jgi:hypothetical protein